MEGEEKTALFVRHFNNTYRENDLWYYDEEGKYLGFNAESRKDIIEKAFREMGFTRFIEGKEKTIIVPV